MRTAPLKRIILLGNDPADKQWSVLDYGSHLQSGLSAQLKDSAEVLLRAPNSSWLNPLRKYYLGSAAALHYSRQITYPALIRKLPSADLYHLLDHGNGALVRHLDRKKTVVFCHDLIPLIFRKELHSFLPWFSERAFDQALAGMCQAGRIVCNSNCTKQDILKHLSYPADKIDIVLLGIDPELRPASSVEEIRAIRSKYNLPINTRLILHSGQNVFYKNIDGLLQILQCLTRKSDNIMLVRIGGFFNSRQKKLADSLGASSCLRELGPLPREAVREIYRAVDLLVQPSFYEGMGIPPLEAMACGIPVVVSNRGALPETVGSAGRVADPDNAAHFADEILSLLENPAEVQQLRQAGFARAKEYSWFNVCQKTIVAYQKFP